MSTRGGGLLAGIGLLAGPLGPAPATATARHPAVRRCDGDLARRSDEAVPPCQAWSKLANTQDDGSPRHAKILDRGFHLALR